MHRLRLALLTAVAVVLAVALVQATRALDAEVVATSGPATQQVTTAAPITDGASADRRPRLLPVGVTVKPPSGFLTDTLPAPPTE